MFILSLASACLKNLGRGTKRLEKLVVLNKLDYSNLLLLDFILGLIVDPKCCIYKTVL